MPPPRTILAISERTDREWPSDHELRRPTVLLSDAQIKRTEGFLICRIAGEPGLPPAPDDRDVEATCGGCPTTIVHRASAPKHLTPICWRCWQRIEKGEQ